MEQIWPYVVVGLVIALVYVAGGKGAEATQTAFEGYFRGFRPDPWPHGVQEEDIDHHWGSRSRDDVSANVSVGPGGSPSGTHWSEPSPELAELTAAEATAVATRPVRGFRVHSHT